MKFPKFRSNIYIVQRRDDRSTVPIGAFSDLVEADNYKDACAAEWFDKTKDPYVVFEISLTTFYG
jgi:hypothetical protein